MPLMNMHKIFTHDGLLPLRVIMKWNGGAGAEGNNGLPSHENFLKLPVSSLIVFPMVRSEENSQPLMC